MRPRTLRSPRKTALGQAKKTSLAASNGNAGNLAHVRRTTEHKYGCATTFCFYKLDSMLSQICKWDENLTSLVVEGRKPMLYTFCCWNGHADLSG